MSSVIFQPLLHDPLGWKSSNTTYADTFKWRKHRSTSKDKKTSSYGQQYQRQLRKKQQQQQQQINTSLPSTTTAGEQTFQRVISAKKIEENRDAAPRLNRCLSSKSAPAFIEETQVSNAELKQRTASTNREATCGSRASQRPPTAPPAVEETVRPATSLEIRRASKEEKEKVTIDANNDNSRHWLTYPNPKTPQYLVDVKQRLGQLKIPSTLARPTSESNLSAEQQQQQQQPSQQLQRSESSVTQRSHQQNAAEQRHLFDFNLPQTPADLRAARNRIDKHRYNPSLDNFPIRPQTCPIQSHDTPKPITPLVVVETKDEQLPPIETEPVKDDAWTNNNNNNDNNNNNNEEPKTDEHEMSTIMLQPVDVDSYPNDYVEAVEAANRAQEQYFRNFNTNDEKKPENCVYRLPAMPTDYKNDSFIAYRNQQRSTTPNANLIRGNDFGSWVRNATNRERESAMKILQDVLNQPVMGYDIPTKPKAVFKQPPVPPPVRTSSGTRKLGRTRTHQRLPCEICEKQLIKHQVWNLSRSETLSCPHEAQTIKQPTIQVRAS
ncbi:unnamed protein product [Rotaria socialis]|uniref:Uncharacterized protein n=1 Tax=Rotaria socialis TaxID=392032 RepID=A0A818MN04_9BILA|nr:unnamed protein product [Rotaria socialis]CAF3591944.1 unnamed protein product [Rotaria socialis]CAF3655139.1 unnamed protein product [Rotaria socialis]CAF3778399.1 unnamed protein product [Rotaria socialis]CAF4140652.1 unnamed protein product [Rotaria socialis]